jgi:hypothetical protein
MFFYTHTNQSMANNNETFVTGASIAVNTINNSTRAALGTLADDIDAAVDVKHTVTISANPSVMPLIWAMNTDATEMYRAVPSMLMLHPMGSTNRTMRLSMFNFSFIVSMVSGSAAALRKSKRIESN